MDRRHFLQALSAGSLAASLSRFTCAQNVPATDYKALVCVFLFGGNDGNNMIIPAQTGYSDYAAVRSANSGLNITKEELLPFKVGSMTETFGMHPAMTGLHELAQAGHCAVLANVGTLLAPTTVAQYLANVKRPQNLFSHSDQQNQWQSCISDEITRVGWGARLADASAALNNATSFPAMTSVAGSTLYVSGAQQSPLAIPNTGNFGLQGFGSSQVQQARLLALRSLMQLGQEHQLVNALSEQTLQAIELANTVNPIVSNSNSAMASFFNTTGNTLSAQLLQVAKLIEARNTIGLKRQIFFVALNGFDTHTNQLATQQTLLGYLSAGLRSFYNALTQLGVVNQVTAFTLSDFGRTFKVAAGGSPGSDHAWGNHQLIVGGAVNGGLYGKMPVLQLGGADDVGKEGRWLPTTSVDQYAATLATWFGIPAAQLASVVPNIGQFAQKQLGFLNI